MKAFWSGEFPNIVRLATPEKTLLVCMGDLGPSILESSISLATLERLAEEGDVVEVPIAESWLS